MRKGLQELLLYFLDITWFHVVHANKLPYHGLVLKLSIKHFANDIAELIWIEAVLGELGVSLKEKPFYGAIF
jgi:hypothetical protein